MAHGPYATCEYILWWANRQWFSIP